MSLNNPIRIALLGAGRIGQVHAAAIHRARGARLVGAADPVAQALDRVCTEYDARPDTIDGLIDADDIDAVLIATPTNTHADLIERAAHAGKAIFCEKPIDLDRARVEQCLATVEQTGARLMLGFNRRFDPNFAALKARLDSGEVGELEQLTITSRDPSPPPIDYIKVSGGLFRDMMIHDFDMARFLIGEPFVRVHAIGSVLVDNEVGKVGDIDTAMVLLTSASGKQCTIINSRRATYGYDQRIEIHASDGMLRAGNPRQTTLESASSAGYSRDVLHDFFMTRYASAYALEIESFVGWLDGTVPNVPTGIDGLQALVLADAALESLNSGQGVALDLS